MKQFSLEEYLKNPNKEVVTRDGRKVRVICTDFDNELYPIIGGVQGEPFPRAFTKEGLLYDHTDTDTDLFFTTEKHEGWVNIYPGSIKYGGEIYDTENDAKNSASSDVIATAKIEWEE